VLSLGLVACALTELPEDQRKPDLVKIGTSPQQVEALMGSSLETCWGYERGDWICFADGRVNAHLGTGGTVSADNPAEVSIGMPQDRVARLLGKPDFVGESYTARQDGYLYKGTFEKGKLIEFKAVPPPPVD
jgi:hypothetical protein